MIITTASNEDEIGIAFTIEPTLDEDYVWNAAILPVLDGLPENIIDLWQYCVTEMVNNVVDHSAGSRMLITVLRSPSIVEIDVFDNGIGIFRKIKTVFGLESDSHAILELAKGKLTTDPANHSGQGIPFTSRMLDSFSILSHGVYFSHQSKMPVDWIDEGGIGKPSTMVSMAMQSDTDRTLKDVFDQYSSGDDYDFSKTVVPLRLAKLGEEKLISRSQAKRATARIERFKSVVFDFAGIEMIGQAFADQIFRVWARSHEDVRCVVIDANPEIRKTIASVGPAPNVVY